MSSETIRSSFTMVAWGMVLALFDLRINEVVITPDVIGYILIAVGLGKLVSLESQLDLCARLAWVLAPLSLLEYVPSPPSDLAPIFLLLSLGIAVLQFVFLFNLCSGVEGAAQRAKCWKLADRATTCRTLVFIFLVLGLVILAVVYFRLVDLLPLAVIVGLLFSLFLVIMLFLMLTQAGRDLGAESLTT
jgi:hypothetical protein